jgi:hypothetical protein
MSFPSVVVAGCETFKFCPKCQEFKELSIGFYGNARTFYRKTCWCRECMANYAESNIDRLRGTIKAWRHKNVEKLRAQYAIRARSVKGRYSHTKAQARLRCIVFDLTAEEYESLIATKFCHYCEGALGLTGVGLDRKDSCKGYRFSNCVPCCLKCNRIRGEDNITYEEMLEVAALLKKIRSRK